MATPAYAMMLDGCKGLNKSWMLSISRLSKTGGNLGTEMACTNDVPSCPSLTPSLPVGSLQIAYNAKIE